MADLFADNLATCHRCPLRERKAVCPLGGRELLYHAQAGDCPKGYHAGTPLPEAAKPSPPDPAALHWLASRGRSLWAELHGRAHMGVNAADLPGEPAWLSAFAKRVPCGECREHWNALVAANPPDLSSPDAYFAWTVDRHNDVNRRLGKPQWPGKDGA